MIATILPMNPKKNESDFLRGGGSVKAHADRRSSLGPRRPTTHGRQAWHTVSSQLGCEAFAFGEGSASPPPAGSRSAGPRARSSHQFPGVPAEERSGRRSGSSAAAVAAAVPGRSEGHRRCAGQPDPGARSRELPAACRATAPDARSTANDCEAGTGGVGGEGIPSRRRLGRDHRVAPEPIFRHDIGSDCRRRTNEADHRHWPADRAPRHHGVVGGRGRA